MAGYKTVKESAQAEYITKKSRFIGYAAPVTADAQAMEFIEAVRKKHRDATHNVYAYSLRDGQLRRYSDDGEPQGTAGLPVLGALTGAQVVDCAVVVTRYFGGTLLGTGGLVRAYSHTAALALDAAGIALMCEWEYITLHCDYGFYGKLAAIAAANGAQVTDTVFSDEVAAQLRVPLQNSGALLAALTEASAGKAECKRDKIVYEF